jgi:hypothetical protein
VASKKAVILTLPNLTNASMAGTSDSTLTPTMQTIEENIKLAGIEFCPAELQAAIDDGRQWLAKGRTLYAIRRTENGGFSACPVYNERGDLPLVSRGRFVMLNAASANALVGFELCLS